MTCLKTGLDLYLPQYDAVVRTDLHATRRAFAFTGVYKDRFHHLGPDDLNARSTPKLYHEHRPVAVVGVTDDCVWHSGVLVADPFNVEFNEYMLRWLGELQMEYGVDLPPSAIA